MYMRMYILCTSTRFKTLNSQFISRDGDKASLIQPVTTSGIAGGPSSSPGCDWPSPETVGVAPSSNHHPACRRHFAERVLPVPPCPLYLSTPTFPSPGETRTAYPLNESSPDLRRTSEGEETRRRSWRGKRRRTEDADAAAGGQGRARRLLIFWSWCRKTRDNRSTLQFDPYSAITRGHVKELSFSRLFPGFKDYICRPDIGHRIASIRSSASA